VIRIGFVNDEDSSHWNSGHVFHHFKMWCIVICIFLVGLLIGFLYQIYKPEKIFLAADAQYDDDFTDLTRLAAYLIHCGKYDRGLVETIVRMWSPDMDYVAILSTNDRRYHKKVAAHLRIASRFPRSAQLVYGIDLTYGEVARFSERLRELGFCLDFPGFECTVQIPDNVPKQFVYTH
jgi:hypothetical protein